MNVAHVIITDLDPLYRGRYVLSGLKRAAALADDELGRSLTETVEALVKSGPDTPVEDARRTATDADVFVGTTTLELDLTPLLAQQMIAAHNELQDSSGLNEQFVAAVTAVAGDTDTTEDRKELLRRITAISKGRYAQRLASHIDALTRTDLLGDLDEPARFVGFSQADTARLLLDTGRAGYILAALDRISWKVCGHSLLTTPPDTTDHPDGDTATQAAASAINPDQQ